MPKRFKIRNPIFVNRGKSFKKKAITLKFVLSIFKIFLQPLKKKKFSLKVQLSIIHQIKREVNFSEEISTLRFVKYLDFDFST